jgi:hypothetical protein
VTDVTEHVVASCASCGYPGWWFPELGTVEHRSARRRDGTRRVLASCRVIAEGGRRAAFGPARRRAGAAA